MFSIDHSGAMFGDETSARDSAIAALFSRCSSQFRNFYAVIVCKDRQTYQINIARLTDELGRLGGWGGNSGADRMGRGSLDEKLRDNQNLKSVILNLLEDLYDTLERVTFLAMDGDGDDSGVTSGQPQAVGQDRGRSRARSSNAKYSSNKHRVTRRKKREMTDEISFLYRQINLLYHASRNIRRPYIGDIYIPSALGARGTSYSAELDQISEKVREWALYRGHSSEKQIAAQYLVSRLAFANTRRRKQLRFWREHPGRPASVGTQPVASTREQLAALVLLADTFAGAATPPEGTERSFSGLAKLVLIGAGALSENSRTSGEPSTYGWEWYWNLMNIPYYRSGRLAFDCPLCFAELEVDILEWREHVLSDIRPYVCTFEKCPIPGKLYPTKYAWFSHEMQIHRRRWVCERGCNSSFNTKEGIEKHMKKRHEGEFAESKLPTLLKMWECQADPDEMTNCPLCPKASRLYDLQDHLATHMENLSCLVLPSEVEDPVRGPELFDADDMPQSQPATSAESAHTAKLPKEIDQGTLWKPTPLQEAAGDGQMHLVDTLLRAGVKVNAPAKGQGGRTALQAAAGGGYLHIVERLLIEGAEVNAPAAKIQGRTALQAAAEGGHLPVVERLLRAGADVNAKASDMRVGMQSMQEATAGAERSRWRTKLQAAAENVQFFIARRLLREGSQANTPASGLQGGTAIQTVAESELLPTVARPLEVATKILAAESHSGGRTALQTASEGGNLPFVERLQQTAANVITRASESLKGLVPIQTAAAGSHLDKGDQVMAVASTKGGRTALQAAAEGGHLSIVERLLEEGAEVNAPASNYGGTTALRAAAEGGYLSIVDVLLERGADVDAGGSSLTGGTAAEAATKGGYTAVFERLRLAGIARHQKLMALSISNKHPTSWCT